MGEFSAERMKKMQEASHLYFDWLTTLADAGITEVQDLQGQYLLKCPFHEDKRPSFRIRIQEHNYHCFSCNAYGTVANLMWRLSGQSLPEGQFMEQLLKRNPAMQAYLGFNSLYLDHTSLHEGFNSRRRFNPKDHLGSTMPLSVLRNKIRRLDDSWEALTFSLTMLQEGERPDDVLARLTNLPGHRSSEKTSPSEVVSLASLVLEEKSDD